MTSTFKLTANFTAATLLLLGVAAAAPALAQGAHGGPRALDFDAIDADASGTLSAAELTDRATGRISEADTNADGALDRDEIIAAMPGAGPAFAAPFGPDRAAGRADRMLAMMGASESGEIVIVEMAGRQTDRLLAIADTDGDGEISREEADAMQSRRAERGHDHDHDRDHHRYHDDRDGGHHRPHHGHERF